ncbi:hypothetical protein DFJ74DRAFT_770896 [Hyaloraphidium curvatum]|nr:hypothetical protein DFJ74DRAFT_770896 [Hyaloraphidium curvatum]
MERPPPPGSDAGTADTDGSPRRRPPPRAKAGSVRRSCDVCSLRRVKCDATLPACRRCIKSGAACNYSRSKKRGPKRALDAHGVLDEADDGGKGRARRRKGSPPGSDSPAGSPDGRALAGVPQRTASGRRVSELRIATAGFATLPDGHSPRTLTNPGPLPGGSLPPGTYVALDMGAANFLPPGSPFYPGVPIAQGQPIMAAPGPGTPIGTAQMWPGPTPLSTVSPANTLVGAGNSPQSVETPGQYVIIQTQYQPPGVAAVGPGGQVVQYTPGQLVHYATGQTIQVPGASGPGGGPQIYILPQQPPPAGPQAIPAAPAGLQPAPAPASLEAPGLGLAPVMVAGQQDAVLSGLPPQPIDTQPAPLLPPQPSQTLTPASTSTPSPYQISVVPAVGSNLYGAQGQQTVYIQVPTPIATPPPPAATAQPPAPAQAQLQMQPAGGYLPAQPAPVVVAPVSAPLAVVALPGQGMVDPSGLVQPPLQAASTLTMADIQAPQHNLMAMPMRLADVGVGLQPQGEYVVNPKLE